VCVYRCVELKCGVLWDYSPTPCSIGDPPTAPHVQYVVVVVVVREADELLCGGYK